MRPHPRHMPTACSRPPHAPTTTAPPVSGWTIGASTALLAASLLACSGSDSGGGDDDNRPAFSNTNTNNSTSSNSTSNNNTSGTPSEAYQGLIINELAAAGEPSDWVELYNSTDAEIDLSALFLTDDIAGEPTKGAIPTGTTIAAGAYLQIFIGDDTVGFGIGGDEELALVDPDGNIIDQADWDEGDSPDGGSYGRIPDRTGDFRTLSTPTPGAPN
ncbi:MAG: lamin tail domain-containing protein, partial [Myxococcota bacterium]